MAATQVYNTLELRCAILSLLDRPMLAVMLRLEKGVTASVAAILYREIPRAFVSRMSRASRRRAAYCDAVQILDWSVYTPSHRITAFRDNSRSPPILFDPEVMLRKIRDWTKKYPNLRTIRYRFPDRDSDDAWVIHLGGPKIVVELESRVKIAIKSAALTHPLSLPTTPTHESTEFRHTLITLYISLIGPIDPITPPWKKWIFQNPEMDRRITGIIFPGVSNGHPIGLAFTEALSYLALRKEHGYPPLTQFAIDTSLTPEQLQELATALGPDIRRFYWSGSDYECFGDPQYAIDIFTETFPKLDTLWIDFDLRECEPEDYYTLCGLPTLRQLAFHTYNIRRDLGARYISGLGGKDCVYMEGGAREMAMTGSVDFHEMVQEYRAASRIEYL